ncbi:DUF1499 domain-containing protein [Alteriqipengyuania flavescens]|uniref:DUF1499 domain-containing protein n=1 Tax=Alteriqipengyuania flavescens TaxID=3053610 RepID=UPI0025B61C36|nr:DUF1499 domain-containing protein [Alteriqipengyuania flavescens]WJY18864.1 DUF1499 domain-containing protein [Alteriqipengyuania flavescens]WJY24804.1 DUF1499 domain-containing protein [Alteriqipengyuania flavescens]
MKTPRPRIALWLALALVLWFAGAVFGPKFGLIEWPFALGTMVRQLGPIVRPGEDGGSVINFRSTSRVGLSDLGYNADRIVKLRPAAAEQLP